MTYEQVGDEPIQSMPIDQLLSQPAVQGVSREFINEIAAMRAKTLQSWCVQLGTVQNEPVGSYATAIDERGLIVDVTTVEKTVTPNRFELQSWSNPSVAATALGYLAYGTEITGMMIDLKDPEPEIVILKPLPTGHNNLDAVKANMALYKDGGSLFLFGAKRSSSVTADAALRELQAAVTNAPEAELDQTRMSVSEDLRQRGAYLLATALSRFRGGSDQMGRIDLLDADTEYFNSARVVNGF